MVQTSLLKVFYKYRTSVCEGLNCGAKFLEVGHSTPTHSPHHPHTNQTHRRAQGLLCTSVRRRCLRAAHKPAIQWHTHARLLDGPPSTFRAHPLQLALSRRCDQSSTRMQGRRSVPVYANQTAATLPAATGRGDVSHHDNFAASLSRSYFSVSYPHRRSHAASVIVSSVPPHPRL